MKMKLFFLTIILMIFTYIFGQGDSIKPRKNSIKGIVGTTRYHFLSLLSLGYEREISQNSSIDIVASALFVRGEYTLDMLLQITSSYKYYIPTKRRLLKNIWISGYLSFHKSWQLKQNDRFKNYIFGVGSAFGKRTFFSSRKRCFFDIGFGGSINYALIYNLAYCTLNKNWGFIPRPILAIGVKF